MAKSKRSPRKKKGFRFKLDAQARQDILAALLLLAIVFTLLSFFSLAGSAGLRWKELVGSLFGWIVVPVLVIGLAFSLALFRLRVDPTYFLKWQIPIGAAVLLATTLAALHLLASAGQDPRAVAQAGKGGGWVGYAMSQALLVGLGLTGTILVLLALGVIGVVLTFNISLHRVFGALGSLKDRLGSFYRYTVLPIFNRPRITANGRPPVAVKPKAEPSKAPPSPARPGPAPGTKPEKQIIVPQIPLGPGQPAPPREWTLPSLDLLDTTVAQEMGQADIRRRIRVIEETLASFNIQTRVVEVNQGPTVTQFGVQPAPGITVNRIVARQNDLALALGAYPLRIEAPVPGKTVVGIEVPNTATALVGLRGIIETAAFQKLKARSKLAIALGQDVSGQAVAADLAKMPHLLIAGATGSGKSVCINSIIACLLFHTTPDEVRFIMVDPKMVELTNFNGIPHLVTPVVTEADKVVNVLKHALQEMNRRYHIFRESGARNIETYNRLASSRGRNRLPYMIIIIDELADMMMLAPEEVEKGICRIAQMARATGIHLVIATQRPSVDVITGLIKANIPGRISFAVTSQVDSRVILDAIGAEKLLGRGDMLYMAADSSKTMRLQGAFVSDRELEAVVTFWKGQHLPQAQEALEGGTWIEPVEEESEDALFEQAVKLVQESGRASTSYLQRKLHIGYNRAATLMDLLVDKGIVRDATEGGRYREVRLKQDEAAGTDS